jgi:hypothetical protein
MTEQLAGTLPPCIDARNQCVNPSAAEQTSMDRKARLLDGSLPF